MLPNFDLACKFCVRCQRQGQFVGSWHNFFEFLNHVDIGSSCSMIVIVFWTRVFRITRRNHNIESDTDDSSSWCWGRNCSTATDFIFGTALYNINSSHFTDQASNAHFVALAQKEINCFSKRALLRIKPHSWQPSVASAQVEGSIMVQQRVQSIVALQFST